MTRTIAITAFTCLHALLSPASVNPVLASSALTNYPVRESKPVRETKRSRADSAHDNVDKKTTAASKPLGALPAKPVGSLSAKSKAPPVGNRLPPAIENALLLGDLTFDTNLLGKSATDQALILSNAYVEAMLQDKTKSRPIQLIRGVVQLSHGQPYISGHFDKRALKAYVNVRNLDNMNVVISVREYEWFGHGDRLGTKTIALRTLLEALGNEDVYPVEIDATKTKLSFIFVKPDSPK